MSYRRGATLSALVCLLTVVGYTGTTFAQLSDADIEALRERGRIEGWTQRDLPASFDWRDYGGCTPIRNQGGCGSCWAFSAVGAVECAILINDGVSVDLSEQWLVSCSAAGDCGGGWHSAALNVMKLNPTIPDQCGDAGAVLESAFPYVAWDAPCGCPYDHPYWINNVFTASDRKQAIMDHGPISVTVAVNSAFQAYDNGVFNACWDGTINHAVVLVGWDDNQGSDGVWIMRNSWGPWWGEDGYMRIEYGCSKIGTNPLGVRYRPDCNANGVRDDYDIDLCDGSPWCGDCDGNGVPDECDIAAGDQNDVNGNGIPDSCDFAAQNYVCVNPGATGANLGTNWNDAVTDLNVAYQIARNEPGVSEVWLHNGTYKPAQAGGDRSASITVPNGITLRGSFAGTETSPDQRDAADPAVRTVFSGDLNGDDLPGFVNVSDNSYHVVTFLGGDENTGLDGITIMGGNADGADSAANGGGLLCCDSSPSIVDCAFLGNRAVNSGGAAYNDGQTIGGSSPLYVNCVFSGNHAEGSGGAMGNMGNVLGAVSPTLINCTVANNSAAIAGGVSIAGNSTVTLKNTVLYGNTDITGEAEWAQIFGGDAVVEYCCVEGLTGALGGVGNIDADPMFRNAKGPDELAGTADDDLGLKPCSPCTDAGENSVLPAGITTDFAGLPRFVDDLIVADSGSGSAPVVDIGAFEFNGEHIGDLDADGDVDLSDLALILANYGQTSGMSYQDGDMDGDGDVDLSDLSAMLAVYGSGCG